MCDDDKFGGFEVYVLCVMMINLELWKLGSLHNVCDDDKFAGLQVCKFMSLHIVCDDDRFGSSEV